MSSNKTCTAAASRGFGTVLPFQAQANKIRDRSFTLKLSERTPNAINPNEADNRLPGFPKTVHWPAEDQDGNRVMVLIGFNLMSGEAINEILAADREMIETVAS